MAGVKTETTTVTTHTVTLSGKDIAGRIMDLLPNKPGRQWAIYVQVPGGGDWSNQRLDITAETPLVVVATDEGADNG